MLYIFFYIANSPRLSADLFVKCTYISFIHFYHLFGATLQLTPFGSEKNAKIELTSNSISKVVNQNTQKNTIEIPFFFLIFIYFLQPSGLEAWKPAVRW